MVLATLVSQVSLMSATLRFIGVSDICESILTGVSDISEARIIGVRDFCEPRLACVSDSTLLSRLLSRIEVNS
jgi:hypothetical protein